jgi:hypothetical protein
MISHMISLKQDSLLLANRFLPLSLMVRLYNILQFHSHEFDLSFLSELKSEVDMAARARGDNYCGSCYGGIEPENGCCNTCEDVRQAYLNRGWSFNNPDAIDQVGHILIGNFDKVLNMKSL